MKFSEIPQKLQKKKIKNSNFKPKIFQQTFDSFVSDGTLGMWSRKLE